MKIAVYGLGYVGLTAAVCLAREGHDVVGVDVSEDKVRLTRAGVSTIREPGMDALLAEALVKRALRCTTDASEPIEDCEIAIVCVGTPTGLDGAHNMSFITEVSRQIARAIDAKRRAPLTVVYRSTVRPGTVENLILPIFRAALGPGGRDRLQSRIPARSFGDRGLLRPAENRGRNRRRASQRAHGRDESEFARAGLLHEVS
jgi:GDP-mannose 6-dehydrogenase